jgi:hypothetical protein
VDRVLAVDITDKLKDLNGPLNEVMVAIEKITDVEQRRTFRRTMAGVVATIYTEIQIPIGTAFPDLLPDGDDLNKTL